MSSKIIHRILRSKPKRNKDSISDSAEGVARTSRRKRNAQKFVEDVTSTIRKKRLLREICTTGMVELDTRGKDIRLLDGRLVSIKAQARKLPDGRVISYNYAGIWYQSLDELIAQLQKVREFLVLSGEKTSTN